MSGSGSGAESGSSGAEADPAAKHLFDLRMLDPALLSDAESEDNVKKPKAKSRASPRRYLNRNAHDKGEPGWSLVGKFSTEGKLSQWFETEVRPHSYSIPIYSVY